MNHVEYMTETVDLSKVVTEGSKSYVEHPRRLPSLSNIENKRFFLWSSVYYSAFTPYESKFSWNKKFENLFITIRMTGTKRTNGQRYPINRYSRYNNHKCFDERLEKNLPDCVFNFVKFKDKFHKNSTKKWENNLNFCFCKNLFVEKYFTYLEPSNWDKSWENCLTAKSNNSEKKLLKSLFIAWTILQELFRRNFH